MDKRLCNICKQYKDFIEFYKRPQTKCKECVKKYTHKCYIQDPESRKQYDQEKRCEYRKNYKKTHLSAQRHYSKKYRLVHPEYKIKIKTWRILNSDKVMIYNKIRKHANRTAGTLDYIAFIEKFNSLDKKCVYCRQPLTLAKYSINSLTIDHDIPIKRGGTNIIINLLPACRSCNSKKFIMTAKEYLQEINNV